MESIPDNLMLFSTEWTSYILSDDGTEHPVVLSGIELAKGNSENVYNTLVLDAENINLVTLHGQEYETGAKDKAEIIRLRELQNKGIDYLALGHVHAYKRGKLDGRGIYCYPGCLEPRGFDETGEHGFVMLSINEETGVITDTFVPFATRQAYICHADVTGASSITEAIDMIDEAFDEAGYRDGDMVELYIEGDVEVDCDIDEVYIANRFKTRFFAFKCKKLTRVRIDYDAFTLDASLKGEFVLVLEGAQKIADEQELTLEYAVETAKKLIENGEKPTEAAKQAAAITGFKKNEIYRELL